MSWLEDWLPLPGVRTMEDEEPFDVVLHVLAALAAGIAAMQLLIALALSQPLAAVFAVITLAATGTCVIAWPRCKPNRLLLVIGGTATVLVWLGLAIQTAGEPMLVSLAIAGVAAALTRRLVSDAADSDDEHERAGGPGERPSLAWIEDDREGLLST